jgi:hypothetical protein
VFKELLPVIVFVSVGLYKSKSTCIILPISTEHILEAPRRVDFSRCTPDRESLVAQRSRGEEEFMEGAFGAGRHRVFEVSPRYFFSSFPSPESEREILDLL